jgi:hypothetical protein
LSEFASTILPEFSERLNPRFRMNLSQMAPEKDMLPKRNKARSSAEQDGLFDMQCFYCTADGNLVHELTRKTRFEPSAGVLHPEVIGPWISDASKFLHKKCQRGRLAPRS